MCGISGVISNKLDRKLREKVVVDMTKILHHRGPDSHGYYFDEQVSFGHNRLSLVDLHERSNQPYEEGDFVLVFNGEIYNFKALRERLTEQNRVSFSTTSDTEVLFYALIHWGIKKTLAELRGMFAFAFYDKKKETVIIARDRIGIKPLFYSNYDGNLYFASELKAITKGAGFNDILPQWLIKAPLGIYEYSRRITAFRHINQLEPGTYLEYDINTRTSLTHTYFKTADWVDEAYYRKLEKSSFEEVTEQFDEILNKAVHSMIVADAPMGAFVSGGLDSSVCAAISKKYRDLNLYTSNVIGKYSEYKDAKCLAAHLGTTLHNHDFTHEMFIQGWIDSTWHYEAPIVVHPNAVPFQYVSQLTSQNGDKAVITGEGSDELFLGYPRLLTRRYNQLIMLPFTITESIYKRIPGLTRYLNLDKTNYLEDMYSQVMGYEKQLLKLSHEKAYAFIGDSRDKEDQLRTPRMIDESLHSLLWRNDRMGMMHSIESRFPFLDEDVMKFGMNLPVKFKIARTSRFYNWKHPFLMDKAVVRKMSTKYLPDNLSYKVKQGFPMYGLIHLTVTTDFFKGGFLQTFLALPDAALSYMQDEVDKYLLAKLASVEIWGSLFYLGQTNEEIKARLLTATKFNL